MRDVGVYRVSIKQLVRIINDCNPNLATERDDEMQRLRYNAGLTLMKTDRWSKDGIGVTA